MNLLCFKDWDFPHFAGSLDIKLPGVNSDAFDVHIPACCGAKPLDIYITGKWFNYGIIFIVMILDLNMWKNQIFYEPFTYGQYTDPEGYIYTVSDRQFLRWGNRTLMTYEWRWNHINPKTNRTYGLEDVRMNSKYKGYSLTLKCLAFVPSIAAFCIFGYLLWLVGLEENPDEALVHKYRRDIRRHRQMKRLRKKKRLAERIAKAKLSGQPDDAVGWVSIACEQALHLGDIVKSRRARGTRARRDAKVGDCPTRLRRSLTRSRAARFTRPNRRACSQAKVSFLYLR